MSVDTVTPAKVCGSRSLAVAVRQNAIVVPMLPGFEPFPLDQAGLRLVEGLAAGACERADLVKTIALEESVDEAPLQQLLDGLVARGLVVDLAAEVPSGSSANESGLISQPPATFSGGEVGDVGADAELVLPVPVVLRVTADGFEHYDHQGRVRVRLTAGELMAASVFRAPITRRDAFEAHQASGDRTTIDAAAFEALTDRIVGAGLVVPYDPDDPVHSMRTRQTEKLRDAIHRKALVNQEFDRLEDEWRARSGPPDRVPVLAVHDQWYYPPAALGVLIAYAKAYEGGALEQAYDFRPRVLYDERQLERAVGEGPVIALFSNYVWCHEQNLVHSALVKERSTDSVTVHGGPNTPSFEADAERFFAQNPHVDVTVRGEGEATLAEMLSALSGSVGDGPPDLSVLGDVAGLSFRLGDRVIRTQDRERIADLDSIPSPVLTGIFDGFIPVGSAGGLSLETNRGCPYGCTFCDWGSATLSRIRKFDLDRVFAELEWCARHEFGIGLTDANFGILERDVEIAEKIADLKSTYGYPRIVGNNYAKNTVKHLSRIIDVFTEAGIVAEGKMSMQSMDEGTLATIKRKNIKVEKYDDLSNEFSRNRLPLSVELMMGLPGSSIDTLRNDMQDCIDRNVRATAHETVLLPNSPMNDPAYRDEHGIVARPGEVVKQTSTYTRDEWDQMRTVNNAFTLSENFGVLRQVGMYVRAETGGREIDFYEQLVLDARRDRERWPMVAMTFESIPDLMVPPASWRLFVDEIRTYLTTVVGLVDDSALETVLTVQHALHPARDRVFPDRVELAHDYVSWYRHAIDLRRSGHRADWPDHIRPLRTYPPGSLVVEDPHDVCSTALGGTTVSLSWESMWDFASAVSRPRQRIREQSLVPIQA